MRPWPPRAIRNWGTGFDLDDDAAAYIEALSVAPPISYQIVINDLVEDLKANNLWSLTDDLVLPWLVPSTNTMADSVKNLKNPALYVPTPVNSPTFVPGTGIRYNGTTNYHRSGFAPQTSGSNFQPNSASFFLWVIASQSTAASTTKRHGASDNLNVNATQLFPLHSADMRASCNMANQVIGGSKPNRLGFMVANRSASNASQNYLDAVQQGTSVSVTQARTTREIYIGAFNNNGTAQHFCDETIAGWGFAASMNATQQTNFYNTILAAKAARDLLAA